MSGFIVSPKDIFKELDLENTNYDYLINISPELRKKLAGLSLALIYTEIGLQSLELTRDEQRLLLKTRRVLECELEKKLEKHVLSYDQYVKNIFLPSVEGLCHIADAISGGFVKGVFTATIYASRGAAEQLGNAHQAEGKGFDHFNQTQIRMIENYARSRLEKAQNHDKLHDTCRQAHEDHHRNQMQLLQV